MANTIINEFQNERFPGSKKDAQNVLVDTGLNAISKKTKKVLSIISLDITLTKNQIKDYKII